MVPLEETRHPLLNGSASSFCKIDLPVRTNTYTQINVESFMLILMSRTYLLTSTTNYIRKKQACLTKRDLSNAPIDQLVIISVLSLKVLLLILNYGRTPSSTIFVLPIPLLLLSKAPLKSFKLKGKRKKENFASFRTFGCRIQVYPPGKRKAKFKFNSQKGIFLGFVPRTTQNCLWYNKTGNIGKTNLLE